MAFDIREFNRQMAQWIPLFQELMKRRYIDYQTKKWLEEKLAGYKAWGEEQANVQQRGFENAIKELLIKTGAKGVEPLDRPLLELMNRLNQLGIEYPGAREIGPEEYGAGVGPYQKLMPALATAQEQGEYPSEEMITAATRLLGTKRLGAYLENLEKARTGRVETGLRAKELEEKRKGRKLGEKELGVRKEELAFEKTGKKKKSELEKKLDSKIKERWGVIEKLAKPEEDISKKQLEVWKSRIDSINNTIHSLKEKTGKDPDKKYAKAAKIIKAQGYNKKDLFEDEKLKAWLAENGLNIWIVLEYF